jgi:gluconate 5-dehydrogenase
MADVQDIDLAGTRALVTGGTSGLGLAMAEALAQAGAAVALTSRSAERAEAAAAKLPGTGAIGIAADARDEAAVARAVARAWSRLGGIDLLVNNAGLGMKTVNPRFMTQPLDFWQVPVDGFQAVLGTNLTGYFLMAREVVPRMLAAGAGRIVNISMNHATMNRRGFVPYGPARAGAEALSRIMAADLSGTGITVNILLPGGATVTGMMPPQEYRPAQLAALDPAIMGPPIVWLASPLARDVHDERIVVAAWPGSALGSRTELRGQGSWLRHQAPLIVAGSAAGAALLLITPAPAFAKVVPYLLAFAALALLLQPQATKWLASRPEGRHRLLLPVGLIAVSVYDGYWGAGAGIMTLTVKGLLFFTERAVVPGSAVRTSRRRVLPVRPAGQAGGASRRRRGCPARP